MKAWDEVAGTGDDGLVATSGNGRTPFVADEYGNATVFGTTDNASATFPIDSRIVEFIEYGVLNGAFARGPAMPDANIEDINPLPDWPGPVQVSGGAITAQWVADSASPSGYSLRFTLNAGAASDEAYFEQIVPIGGSANNFLGHTVMVSFVPAVLIAASLTIETQYLDATGATVGSAVNTNSGSFTTLGITTGLRSLIGAQGATARSLRIRIHLLRDGAAATDTGNVPIYDVRMATVPHWFMLSEYSTTPASINTPATPPTPPSHFHAIYAKASDSRVYSKDDSGTERLLYGPADSPTFGTVTTTGAIELGNASDTTLARLGAGSLGVEGVAVSLLGHGAADHADITRSLWLVAKDATTDSGTATTLGSVPDAVNVIALADAATQGCYWSFGIPADWTSGTLSVRCWWSPGSTDASSHAVAYSVDVKSIAAGNSVTGAGTTVTATGTAAARTAGNLVGDATIDTTVTPASANNVVKINVRRVGGDAADTYVGVVNLLAVQVTYTASQ